MRQARGRGLVRRAVRAALALAGLFACGAAQQPAPAPKPTIETQGRQSQLPLVPPRALTAQDAEVWLDGFLPYALERGDVAGAVIVIVKDGNILLRKGYGFADVAKRRPMDAGRNLVRAASVSKLFTWTAVMQLVEQGKIGLDTDINRYLDFRIEPNGRPITMRDLMTHRAGFEDNLKNAQVRSTAEALPLERLVKSWIPRRIYPTGAVPAYSNYGTTLAGYIVQRVSGISFDDYVEQRIFQPLGMRSSSFREPLPAPLKARLANGYAAASGAPGGYPILAIRPAGNLATTGTDMAAFMIAHLQEGRFGNESILRPETARLMQRSTYPVLPAVNSMALGFYEANRNGRKIISHAGDTKLFHTSVHLLLDEGVGLFMAFNSTGREAAAYSIRSGLFEQFTDRYFPGPAPQGAVSKELAAEHARLISGAYDPSLRNPYSFLRFLSLLGGTQVSANPDGTISVSSLTGLNGAPRKWREIAPFIWRDIEGKDRLAAKVAGGKVTMFGTDDSPYAVYLPAAPAAAWLSPVLFASLAVLILTLVAWPAAAINRRRYKAALPFGGRELLAHRLVRVAALLAILMFVAWAIFFAALIGEIAPAASGVDPLLRFLHLASFAVFVLFLVAAIWNVWLAWRGKRGRFGKLWSLVLLLAAAGLLWVTAETHLIDFDVNF